MASASLHLSEQSKTYFTQLFDLQLTNPNNCIKMLSTNDFLTAIPIFSNKVEFGLITFSKEN